MSDGAGPELALAERLLALLDRGAFTSTYKYAVVLALIDLCLEGADEHGAPPTVLTTRQMAEKVIELYWPQARPFDGAVLRQNHGGQAEILTRIGVFQSALRRGATSWSAAKRAAPDPAEELVDRVEWVLIKMPLPKLQRVGGEVREVLYRISWDDGVRQQPVSAYQSRRRFGATTGDFDNRLHLLPDVAESLLRLSGVLRPLLHREWAHKVAQINDLPESRLHAFMFEPERQAVAHLAKPLRELQNGRCFYCEDSVGARPQVDHVIPFARVSDHSLANLVLTDGGCNGNKRDHLPAVAHLRRLRARNHEDEADLRRIAERHPDGFAPTSTWNMVTALYGRLPEGLDLWLGRKDRFESFDRMRWQQDLAA